MAKITKAELQAMSPEELEKFIQERDEEVQKLREIKAVAHVILDEKNLDAQAKAKLEMMSDPERKALLQVLKADGIKTEEKAGTPGSK